MTTKASPDQDFAIITNIGAAVESIPADSIVSRTVYQGPTLRIILFGFAAGQELSEHTSTKEAILHFLDGQARVGLGDSESTTATAGTVIRMRPNLKHSVYAEQDTRMLLYMIGR